MVTDKVAYWIDIADYPEYKQKLALSLNQQTCKSIIKETKALQTWIKNKLSEL